MSGGQILLVEDRFAIGIVQLQDRIDLPPAFDGLLVELGSAALFAVKSRLKLVADAKEQIDRADRVCRRGQMLLGPIGFQMQHRGRRRKDSPVHRISKSLLGGKAVPRPGRRKRGDLRRRGLLAA